MPGRFDFLSVADQVRVGGAATRRVVAGPPDHPLQVFGREFLDFATALAAAFTAHDGIDIHVRSEVACQFVALPRQDIHRQGGSS